MVDELFITVEGEDMGEDGDFSFSVGFHIVFLLKL